VDPTILLVAGIAALGAVLLALAIDRMLKRRRMQARLRTLGVDQEPLIQREARTFNARSLASRLGSWLAAHLPGQAGAIASQTDRAGLAHRVSAPELLGWKIFCATIGLLLGAAAVVEYGLPGVFLLVLLTAVGWFLVDLALVRYHSARRRAILRDLPTVMDLLVLSMEAGMGLDRALRTIVHQYRSPLADELQRVLADTDLGVGRGAAFERMAIRVGIDELRSLSRAIMQSEELGVSLVGVMQTQSRDVRVSRRRAAETEALRAPIKMLFPLVIFILPTLFMLLIGPVGLRAAAALSGAQP
jgi:tight adherence protein C